MNILLIVTLLILSYFITDFALSEYVTNIIKNNLNIYLYGSKIKLTGRDKEIIEGLILRYSKSLLDSKDRSFSDISIINKIRCAYNVHGHVEELIDYLINNYGAILKANKENVDNAEYDKVNKYFVSYIEDDRYITIWFSYLDHQVKIIGGSDTFEKLSYREKYEKLLAILLDIKNGRASDYNHSKGVEDMFMSGLDPELDYYYGDELRSRIIVKERKKEELK